jgi:hypothetical protein
LSFLAAPYDDRSARLHVRRLRDLLGASSIDLPGSVSVFSHFVPSESDDPFATIESASKEQLELEQQQQKGEKPQKGKKTAAQQKKEKQAAHQTHERVFDPRTFELHKIVNAKLSEFYPTVQEATPPQPIKSITYSGWNSPPSYRK